MAPRTHEGRGDERGFVLVGVIVFVLALTILGLSLFSLSGYEAQFLDGSYERGYAFHDAMSGMARAKFALAATNELSKVNAELPIEGFESITDIRAVQDDRTSGPVDWSPDHPIQITVEVVRGGERRIVSTVFRPAPNRNSYRSAFEVTHRVFAVDSVDDHTTHVNGIIRQNEDIASWWGKFGPRSQAYSRGTPGQPGVPEPEVEDFMNGWLKKSSGPPDTLINARDEKHRYGFDLVNGVTGHDTQGRPYRVYDGPYGHMGDQTQEPDFAFSDAWNDDITVEINQGGQLGTVVWLLPGGAHFEEKLEIKGFTGTNLIMVATPSKGTLYQDQTGAPPGFMFMGGIHSPGVNVFIVSDGAVIFGRHHNVLTGTNIGYLSVFAAGAYVRGPKAPWVQQFNHYNSNDVTILTPLYDTGLLPNTLGRTKTFQTIAGSFHDSTASIQ